ncbi:unnamed protein product [Paramecium primaurelia]|uniref:Uncharacterized protein n=1 Tax=Paramecium primaurelia TaxID=5886 RepID=A0A8S1ME67_PARPR|nr:unnamed protein product [Paramecium primaurelia]
MSTLFMRLMLLQIKKDLNAFYLSNLSNIKQLIKDLLKNNQLLIIMLMVKFNIQSIDGIMNIVQKADQYGIKFPDSVSEKDKALIIMFCIFIDYLWFENF